MIQNVPNNIRNKILSESETKTLSGNYASQHFARMKLHCLQSQTHCSEESLRGSSEKILEGSDLQVRTCEMYVSKHWTRKKLITTQLVGKYDKREKLTNPKVRNYFLTFKNIKNKILFEKEAEKFVEKSGIKKNRVDKATLLTVRVSLQ